MILSVSSFGRRWLRARATNTANAIACFHNQAAGGTPPPQLDRSSVVWFVKVVCTLCHRKRSLYGCVEYLGRTLDPPISWEVIRSLNCPKTRLKFFEFSRLRLNVKHTMETYNFLLRSLCQSGLHGSVKMAFDCMRIDGHLPDNSLSGFLVSSLARGGYFDAAEGLLTQLRRDGVGINCFAYDSLLSILVKQNRVCQAVWLFQDMLSSHSRPSTFSCNTIISGLCKTGDVNKALELFNEMKNFGCSPNVITYNIIIDGLFRANEGDKGSALLKEIELRGDFSPNIITYTSVISGYCKLGRMEEASILFNEMINSGVKPNKFTFNALIDGYGKANNMVAVHGVYEKMLSLGCFPDVVTYTSLIHGYCRTGQVDQGLRILHEMNARGLSPNEYTFSVLITALCNLNRLVEARDLLKHPNWLNIPPKPCMYNRLIDGFCKAGNLDEANAIVGEMEMRCNLDKFTFTILILGHCMKGRMAGAIGIFDKMLATGCAPDDVTINSLTSCLLKAGMPNEAKRIIRISLEDWNLKLSHSKGVVPLRTNPDNPVAV